MIAVLQTINSLLDIKLVQWLLVAIILAGIVSGTVFGFKYNSLRLKTAFLEADIAKTNTAIIVQNKAIQEASELAKKIQDRYDQRVIKAQQEADKSNKRLQSILDYDFSGECSNNISEALKIVKEGVK